MKVLLFLLLIFLCISNVHATRVIMINMSPNSQFTVLRNNIAVTWPGTKPRGVLDFEIWTSLGDTLKIVKGIIPTSIETESESVMFKVSQNYPNPFNYSTFIDVHSSKSMEYDVNIYDISGKIVYHNTYKNGYEVTTIIVWNGKDTMGNHISSGIYFIKI